MEEELSEIYKLSPVDRLNYTDPIVRHDPTIEKTTVPAPNQSPESDGSPALANNTMDMKEIMGKDVPVILLNTTLLDHSSIYQLDINYDSFTPSISLIVDQSHNKISVSDSPGMNNLLTVIITSRVDGAYKPASMDFYINETRNLGNNLILYKGTYKLLEIEQSKTEQITFDKCDAEFCKLPENEHPTTYEFLHVIAENAGLGFAATEQVKEIADDKYRFIQNQTYKEVIQQHTYFGGLDENSIFDVWIDLYRYLVIVNVPWVLNEEVSVEDLGHYVEFVSKMAEPDKGDEQDENMSCRILTNYKEINSFNNVLISSYEWVVNNNNLRTKGVSTQCYIGAPNGYSPDNNGSLNQKDIEIEEDSDDGKTFHDDYNYSRVNFLGNEMGNADDGNTPILYQQQLVKNYFRKIRQRRLKVVMDSPNMALQRGTLINILIMEYSAEGIKALSEEDAMEDSTFRNEIANSHPVVNPYISGMYYIDGMSFSYNMDDTKIIQTLYLIKKGPYNNPNSRTAPAMVRYGEQLSESSGE